MTKRKENLKLKNVHYLQTKSKKKEENPRIFNQEKKRKENSLEKKEKRKMATYSLKKYRLKGNEFREVLKKGRGFRVESLVLKLLRKEKEKRFGFLISKKVLKKATQRNKLKRRLREILRERVEKIEDGIRAVFIALPGLEKKDFKGLEGIVEKILKKSKALKDESNL